jgi:hypothetical protein
MERQEDDGSKLAEKKAAGPLDKFEPGGELGPIDDRIERERRLDALAAEERVLAEENIRLADLCHYFAQQNMDIPPHVLEHVTGVPLLTIPDRIRALKNINRELMEYLHGVGHSPQIRD